MKDKKRRIVAQSLWVGPTISAISLPSHAQTSICNMADLVGTWRFVSATHQAPVLYPIFELFPDGTTNDTSSEWGINVFGNFFLRQDVNEFAFSAPITNDCDQLSGTSTSAFDSEPPTGTWSAERVS